MSKKNKPRRTSTTGRTILIILLLAIVAICAFLGAMVFESEKPKIMVSNENTIMGVSSKIGFEIHDNRSGLRSVEVNVEQNGKVSSLYQTSFPRTNKLLKWGPANHQGTIAIEPKKHKLVDGNANLIFTATDYSWNGFLSGNKTIFTQGITIDTDNIAPP